MKTNIKKNSEAKKPGRKASGLRDLPPEAARLAVNRAMLAAVQDAIGLKTAVVKATGMSGGVPTLERLLRGDVALVSVQVVEDGEIHLRPAMRSSDGILPRLKAIDVDEGLLFVAERFVADVEAATVGKLTASYGEGLGGKQSAEPERMLMAMDRLAKAQAGLTAKQRAAVWGLLVFGLSLTDMGWALVSAHRRGCDEKILRSIASLHAEAGLEHMLPHYQARG